MLRPPIPVIALLGCLFMSAANAEDDGRSSDWPQFRGRYAAGVADGQDPPLTWDVESGQNVRWKTRIPGLGHASPVIVGDSVLIVTATGEQPEPDLRVGLYGDIKSVDDEGEQSWELYCLAKNSGAVKWKRTIHQGVPRIKRHTKATHANATPASDGEHIVVFLGSEGLHCFDLRGNLTWKQDLGLLDSGYYVVPAAQWGFGSSPIIYRKTVIVQCDVQQDSFLAAFAIQDGAELWRTARDDVPTWSTPTVFHGDAGDELIVNGHRHAGGYDPGTGKELWSLSGGGDIPVPTPIVANDLLIFSSAHGKARPLFAIHGGARGTMTLGEDVEANEQVAWCEPRDGIYMQTPIAYRDHLYACRGNGVLSCYETRTGKRLYRQRFGKGGFTASPVAADGRLYFTSETGVVHVVRAGSEFEMLAENNVGEICMSTPAITDGLLVVRGKRHVFALGRTGSDVVGEERPPEPRQ